MGYFNIFYKITRIIDFFSRKRNQKFIIGLCLVGVIVFFSPNISNAQYTNLDSQNLSEIRSRIVDIDSTLDTYLGDIYSSIIAQEYDIDAIRSHTNLISNDVNSMKTYLYNTYTHVVTLKNTLIDIDSDIDSLLLKIDSLNAKADNILTACNTIIYDIEYYGELNHADIEDLKDIIKEYLYGDRQEYPITNYFVYGLLGNPTGEVFTNSGNYNTFYFKVKAGYTYHVSWDLSILSQNNRRPRHGFCNVIPKDGVPLTDLTFITEDIREMDVYAEEDTIFWISYDKTRNIAFKVMSDYNEGQDLGIYGGLTIIDQQTQYQGEETRATIQDESQTTRNTITDTSIPTSEMTIDTSIVDGVSNEENDNFLISIINKFQSVITPSSSVTTITIPIPKTGKNIVLRSDLLSAHISNTIIGTYITVFWYVVFFIYFFKFAYRVINWVVTGEIIEKPSGFMKYLMEQNAIITASMM